MLSNKWLIAGATTLGLATAVQAEEHTIVLTGFSYFPSITYAQPGDTVVFVNESGEEQTVVGKDAGWVVGPLQDAEEGSLDVTEETELAFFSAYGDCANGADASDGNCGVNDEQNPGGSEYGTYEDAPIRAEITFEEPPADAG